MNKEKNVAKNLTTAVSLEQELQIAYAQKCVAVLDIYSSEWGNCRAISETFTRLKTEAGDDLRFFQVECNAVLESLKSPDDAARMHQRPKNIDAMRDTLPEGWQSVLEERRGLSEPCFLFYKEGKKLNQVIGVNTPLIRTLVKDLCTVKTPASEFITNVRLQDMWDEYFNPEESEVSSEKFLKALAAVCKLTVSLNDDEKAILFEAIGVAKADGKPRIVHAEGLQKWFGDDESRTVQQAFTDTLPDYEERAIQVRLEREAEEKKRAEEEEQRKAEEEKAAAARKEEEAREEEERKKQQEASKGDRIKELEAEIEQVDGELKEDWKVASGDYRNEALAEWIANIKNTMAAIGANATKEGQFLQGAIGNDAADALAEKANAAIEKFKTVEGIISVLAAKAPILPATVANSVHEASQSIDKNVSGKLAVALLTWDKEVEQAMLESTNDYNASSQTPEFFGTAEDPAHAPIYLTAAASMTSSNEDALYWIGDAASVTADGAVSFPPLAALHTSAENVPEGKTAFKVTGVKNIIDPRPYSPFANCPYVFNAFFVGGKAVADAEGTVEIQIDAYPAEDDYNNFLATYTAEKLRGDDQNLRHVWTLYSDVTELDALKAEEKPAEEGEQKPGSAGSDKPAEEEKAATPAEEKPGSAGSDKPATPAEEEKAATPSEEKPAEEEKAATPTEEKPAEEEKAATPAEEKPGSAGSDKPATPSEEKPAEEEKAATPTEEKPAEEEKPGSAGSDKPAEEKAATPTEEKPAEEKPAEEEKKEDKPAFLDDDEEL